MEATSRSASQIASDTSRDNPFKGKASINLDPFPTDYSATHLKTEWWQQLMVRMSAVPGLTQIAHGEEPAPAKALIDFPLESIPPLPEDHPRYESRLETRIKYEAQNAANQVQRYNIFMQLSTGLFASLYISAKETNPLFAKLLYEACDYRRLDITDGSFDGALAFKMAHTRLFGASRTNADVEFYNVAQRHSEKGTASRRLPII